MITKDELRRFAAMRGIKSIPLAFLDYIQDKTIYYAFKVNSNLIFKGGTALRKLFGSPRMSFDIDFDLAEKRADQIFDEIRKRLINEGFKVMVISSKYIEKIGTWIEFWQVGKKSLGSYSLGIDISCVKEEPESMEMSLRSPYPDIPPITIRVQTPRSILVDKIEAFLRRRNVRDLYDIYFLKIKFGFDIKENVLKDILSTAEKLRREWKGLKNLVSPLPELKDVLKAIAGEQA